MSKTSTLSITNKKKNIKCLVKSGSLTGLIQTTRAGQKGQNI